MEPMTLAKRIRPESALEPRVQGMKPSATLAIQEYCSKLAAEGRSVYRLGLGQSPFPVPSCVVETLRAHASEKDYLPVRGLMQLRAAVAQYHRYRHGIRCTPEDVLVGPGSKELMFILQVVFRGELLLPSPSWVSYEPQARILGQKVRRIATTPEEDFRVLPEQIDEVCRSAPDVPRVIILNYPSNPTGCSYDAAQLEALAEALRRNGVLALSDEIYGELEFQGRHTSIARFYEEGTIVTSGLSKWCGAGGWRLGTMTFPADIRWLLEAMAVVASETYSATSAPIQYAAVRAFQGGAEIETYLQRARRVLAAVCQTFQQALVAEGVGCRPATGGFYLFPSFDPLADRLAKRGIRTSPELCRRILEEAGVACLPGSDFGVPEDKLFMRVALVNFDGARALAACTDETPMDVRFLENHCAPTLRALEALVEWTKHPS
ncbi:MAG TPA: aminotransferase class I/II-fold pyridoxal phosphate-dependent enzyme [Polyangium sp.]|nr:aminotransferase class I/II-fold pyridoxal phosphate-dependent enzyme [Polyangium sp.]